jgi:hypothetical protein
VKWEYRVALFRWRSDVWQEVNNMTDELDRALGSERRFDARTECRDYLGLMMILTAACGPRHQEHSNDHT